MPEHTLLQLRHRTYQMVWHGTRSGERQWAIAHELLTLLGPDTKVRDVTVELFGELCLERWKKAKHAHSTINRKVAVLRRMLVLALEEGWIDELPKLRWMPLRLLTDGRREGRKDRYLEDEEERAIFQELPDHMRDLAVVLVDTGMRVGEALRLRGRDVLLHKDIIQIRRAKSGKPRMLPITSRVRAVLEMRVGTADGLVFPDANQFRFCNEFQRIRKLLGLDDEVTPHVLRHTFATRLVQRGAGIHAVMHLLGHGRIDQTMRYAHHSPEQVERARDLLERGA